MTAEEAISVIEQLAKVVHGEFCSTDDRDESFRQCPDCAESQEAIATLRRLIPIATLRRLIPEDASNKPNDSTAVTQS